MTTSLPLSRHSGLDPETMNAAVAGLDPAVVMDSGFRRNDEPWAVAGGERDD
jgi:hypothetical protein